MEQELTVDAPILSAEPAPRDEGEMARRVRELDWSRTPLGPMEGWPQSLKVAVGICLNSRFPMMIWWGRELTFIYNDSYAPMLGKRHPWALGRSGREVWAEIWPQLEAQVEGVMVRGESSWNERVPLVMERNGFPEIAYFTWSYSPILDEKGGIGGLFNACMEDTQKVHVEAERDRLAGQRQLALDAALMGWWHYDPTTKTATWDERYAQIFGVSGNRAPNEDILRRLHPDDLPRVWSVVEAALNPADPKPYAVEYRVVRDDGSVRWVEANGLAHFEGEGKDRRATSFVGTVADVTERKRAEGDRDRLQADARVQHERTAEILESISDAFYAIDAEFRFTYVNRKAEELWGRRREELIGRHYESEFPKAVGSESYRMHQQVMRERKPAWYETISPILGRWIDVSLYPEPGGGLSCYFRDISERKRNEAALRDNEQQLRALIEQSSAGIAILEPDGRFRFANQRFSDMLGYTREEILSRRMQDVTHPEDVEKNLDLIRRSASDGTAYELDKRYIRKDGGVVWASISSRVLREPDGTPHSVLGVIIDVSERKRIEEERARLVNELETQRARLADVFQRSPSFMAVVRGPDHVFELSNERYDELVGHRDLIGKPVRQALPEVEGQGFLNLLDRVYATGEPFAGKDMVVTLRRQPGQPPEERYVEFVYQPLREADGTVSGIFVHGVDLTERKLAEAALRESEGRLSAILNNMPAMVYLVDKDNRFRFINRGWEPVFGLNVSDASGRSIYDFFPKDVADQFAANNLAVLESGKPHESEEIVPQGDGDHTYISVKVPLFDPDGEAYAICGISTDITDRKRAEEALRRSEAAFRELADAMPQIVFAARPDGEVDYFNRQWHEYTGLPEGSSGFESWRHVHTEEGLRRVTEVWPEALRTGRPYEIEYRLRRHDGAYRWHLGRALPIRDSDGRIIRWFGTNTDIHDYKQLQEQNERLLESERAARVEAERASESKSEFLATLSHELRTPLTPVLLTVSLMERHAGLPDELRNDLTAIRRNVELESRLIGDLLDLTRISKGKLKLDLQDVDLHVVLRSAIDICQREASAKLEVDLRAERHTVRGDSTRLQQIFWNLINNAQKFTPANGTITARSYDAPDGRVRVEIADTGAGIDPAVMPRLFSAFEQGEVRSARQQAGLGLGLAISKQLADAHGGSISASSGGRGRGATFTVELPVSTSLAAEAPVAARPSGTPKATQPMTILLVEDHEPTLRILSRLLTQLGHRVTGVTSVASATTAARREAFDLIISDLGLTDGSGLDVMRQLRDRFAGRGIALTGYGMESDVAASREAGFVEHLTKPVDLAALEAAIGRVRAAGE